MAPAIIIISRVTLENRTFFYFLDSRGRSLIKCSSVTALLCEYRKSLNLAPRGLFISGPSEWGLVKEGGLIERGG